MRKWKCHGTKMRIVTKSGLLYRGDATWLSTCIVWKSTVSQLRSASARPKFILEQHGCRRHSEGLPFLHAHKHIFSFSLFVLPVWVKVLQWADPLSREPYQTSIRKIKEPGKQEALGRCGLHDPRNRRSLWTNGWTKNSRTCDVNRTFNEYRASLRHATVSFIFQVQYYEVCKFVTCDLCYRMGHITRICKPLNIQGHQHYSLVSLVTFTFVFP